MGEINEASSKTDLFPINKTLASDIDIQLREKGDCKSEDVPSEEDITQEYFHYDKTLGLRRRKLRRNELCDL
jgi:hypothetical protein